MKSAGGLTVSRRQVFRLTAGGLAGFAAPGIVGRAMAQAMPLRGGQLLPTPTLFLARNKYRRVAGIRPHRTDGVRLEIDPGLGRDQGKHVIHNYGHGGAGISLSFGCAIVVASLVRSLVPDRGPLPNVAILGSGIVGLTVAKELRDTWPRMKIRILTRAKSIEGTTSILAGGQFAPSGIAVEYERGRRSELCHLLAASAARIKSFFLDGTYRKYGVRERKNYSLGRLDDFDICTPAVYAEPQSGILPFAKLAEQGIEGFEYDTYLIEPPIILRELVHELGRNRVPILWSHEVNDLRGLMNLPETVIVNCTGLGAKSLMNDPKVKPILGQLAVLQNPQQLKYFFSGGCAGRVSYMFGRSNDIVVGGTIEESFTSPDPDPDECERLLRRANTIFEGLPELCS